MGGHRLVYARTKRSLPDGTCERLIVNVMPPDDTGAWVSRQMRLREYPVPGPRFPRAGLFHLERMRQLHAGDARRTVGVEHRANSVQMDPIASTSDQRTS